MANNESSSIDCVLLTHRGLEESSIHELKSDFSGRISSDNITYSPGQVTVSCNHPKDLLEIALHHKQLVGCGFLVNKHQLKNPIHEPFESSVELTTQLLKEIAEKSSISLLRVLNQLIELGISKKLCTSMKVSSIAFTSTVPDSILIQKTVGAILHDKLVEAYPEMSIDLNHPTLEITLIISESAINIMINVAGSDLSKREYKIFLSPAAPKGTVAAGLLTLANMYGDQSYSNNDSLFILDPFCGSGIIPIEAALFQESKAVHSPHKISWYKHLRKLKSTDERQDTMSKNKIDHNIVASDSKLPHITAAKKNAKIAGILDHISFARRDLDWLDTKFDENTVDQIVTMPPPQNTMNSKSTEKIANEFWHQSSFIIKSTGVIVVGLNKPELYKKIAEKHPINIIKEVRFYSGKQPMYALIAKKK